MNNPASHLISALYRAASAGDVLRSDTPYAISAVRVGASAHFVFPATEVTHQAQRHSTLISHGFGLTGGMGTLPYGYTELLARRNRERDTALGEFLDMFTHRAATLLYEGWQAQMWLSPQPDDSAALRSKPARALLAYAGAAGGTFEPTGRDRFLDILQNHAGLFSRRVRTASGLKSLLGQQFTLAVEIEQFVEKWLDMAPEYRLSLRQDHRSFRLGTDTCIGTRTLHLQSFFKVHITIQHPADYARLSPGAEDIVLMQRLIKHYVGEEFDFQLVIHTPGGLLKKESLNRKTSCTMRLGWSSTLGSAISKKEYLVPIFRDYSRKRS